MNTAKSLLFVSAVRLDQVEKALASNADEVIVDLEDAVSADDKVSARENLRSLQPNRRIYVRVNGLNSDQFQDDINVVSKCNWVSAVVIPKVGTGDVVRKVLEGLNRKFEVIALVESALGIENSLEIARSGVSRLIFGSVDYSNEIGIKPNNSLFAYPRSRLVVSSAAAGLIPPVDGPTPNFSDTVTLTNDAKVARSLGMGGKLCIHPNQIDVVESIFRRSSDERGWARAVLAERKMHSHGVFSLEGQMIDAPSIARAKKILEGSDDDQT